MSPDEARRVASVLSEADGGCVVCVSKLASYMGMQIPDYDWFAVVAEVSAGLWTADELRQTAQEYGA